MRIFAPNSPFRGWNQLSVKHDEQDSQQAGFLRKDGSWTSAFCKPLFWLWKKGLQRPVSAQETWQQVCLSSSKIERIPVLPLLAVLVWSCKTCDSLRCLRVFSSYLPCWTLLLSTQAREFIQLCFLLMQWVKGVSWSPFFLDLHIQSKVMCLLAYLLLKCAHFKVSWNTLEMLLKKKHSHSFYIGYKYSLL